MDSIDYIESNHYPATTLTEQSLTKVLRSPWVCQNADTFPSSESMPDSADGKATTMCFQIAVEK